MEALRRVYEQMRLDWTISVPTVAAAIVSAFAAYFAITSDIRDANTHMRFLEDRVAKMENDARKISKIETDIEWIRKLLDQRRGDLDLLIGPAQKNKASL